jgi:hypothetical protein
VRLASQGLLESSAPVLCFAASDWPVGVTRSLFLSTCALSKIRIYSSEHFRALKKLGLSLSPNSALPPSGVYIAQNLRETLLGLTQGNEAFT